MKNIKREKKKIIFSFLNLEKFIITALICVSIIVVFYSVCAIIFPYEMDYVEGLLIHFAKIPIADLYQDLSSGDLVSPVLYSPLVITIFSFLQNTLSAAPLVLGRILSFVAILGVVLIIFLSVKKITKQFTPALIAALWFFCFPITVSMYPVFRVDQLGLFLALAGFSLFFLGSEKKVSRIIAVILLALATFVKITFLVPSLVFIVMLFIYKNKSNKWYGLLYITLLLILHGGIQIISRGSYLLNVFWYSTLNDYSFDRGLVYLKLVAIFFSAFSILFLRSIKVMKAVSLPFSIYLFVVQIMLLSLFRRGVNVNFLFEFTAVWSVMIGIMYWQITTGKIFDNTKRSHIIYKWIYYYFLLLPILISALMLINKDIKLVTAIDVKENYQVIDQYINNNNGSYLSERNGFIVTKEKEMVLDTFQISSVSSEMGYVQEERIISLISDKNFKGIITKKGRSDILALDRPFSISILDAVTSNYRIQIDNDDFTLYVPN